MDGYYKAEDVRREANGRWISILGTLGVRTDSLENRHGPCPGCGGKDRFRWDDKNGDGTWLCSQGGGGNISGDGIALLMHVTGKEWKECLHMVGEIVLGEKGLQQRTGRKIEEGVARPLPRERETWVPEFSFEKLQATAHQAGKGVNVEWFMERSPVDPRGVTPGEFIEHLYRPEERVLIFTEYFSQGNFLWEVGRGGYRLGDEPGVKAVRSKIPTDGGEKGMWFLIPPVDGLWHGNARKNGEPSRRAQESVTGYRYLLLECDEEKTYKKKARALRDAAKAANPQKLLEEDVGKKFAAEMMVRRAEWEVLAKTWETRAPLIPELWMKLLAVCGLPIVAIYSSGGHSLHALVNEPEASREDFVNKQVRAYKKRLPLVGADPAAITAERLTRLPGCTRNGREQRLIYLNPGADRTRFLPIQTLPKVRVL